jgi:hypothetical protein
VKWGKKPFCLDVKGKGGVLRLEEEIRSLEEWSTFGKRPNGMSISV